ncbi:MAG: hypothetical protein DKT66_07630 [Candidatus Melainabacteria bacterium]|nr:MAG: hypothetical protein DKT66_07630 [Candidatus Melainabacteria bacterium]
MPTANIYHSKHCPTDKITPLIPQLRVKLAQQLTSTERKLVPEEISVRIISVDGGTMISPFEMEIKAQNYPDRFERCDEICLHMREFILENAAFLSDASVWLQLTELGHSFIDASNE